MPVQIGAPTISGGGQTSVANALESWAAEKRQAKEMAALEKAREAGLTTPIEKDESGRRVMPEKKKPILGFIGNKTVDQYNKGLRDAYITSIDRDNTTEINRIAQESDGDVQKYQQAVSEYTAKLLSSVDPAAKNIISASLEAMSSRGFNQVQRLSITRSNQQAKAEREQSFDTYGDEAQRLSRNGEFEGAQENILKARSVLDSMVESGDLTRAEADEQFRLAKNKVFEQGHRKEINDIADQDIDAAFGRLQELSEEIPKDVTPDEWDRFIGKTQAELNRRVNRMMKFEKEKAEQAKKMADYQAVEERYRNEDDTIIVDPKVVDNYYQEMLAPQLENMPLEIKQAEQAQFIDRMKAIPKSMKMELSNSINSNNPDLITEAALLIDRIDDIEGVVNQIPENDQAYLSTVVNLLPNMSPAEAIKLARQATDPKDQARIEMVKGQIKEQFKGENKVLSYIDKATDALDPGLFAIGPDVDEVSGAQMGKEYGEIYEAFRQAGMAEDEAFKKADKMINRNWGETKALGVKRVMKYPPEMYYQINGDVTWIKDQLVKDVNAEEGGAAFGVSISAKDIILMANDATARTASQGRPTYAVKVMIDDMFYNIGDWAPDVSKEIARIKKMNVERALEDRKQKMSRGRRTNTNR